MANEMTIQRRLGFKVPRSILWPPYMALNPYFTDLSDSIDTVWGLKLDNAMKALVNIRNVWITNPTMEQEILDGKMIPLQDWSIHERETLVKQVNMLGMKLKSAGILTDENYLIVSRYLGFYWFGKGTKAFIEFINFCLIADLTVENFWSENTPVPNEYNNMTLENPDGTPPGTPIWEGGTWFPTTHVQITATGGLGGLTVQTLAEFFYEIANYNLVLRSIENSFNMPVVDRLLPRNDTATIVALGMYRDHGLVMSTAGRYGATPPPRSDLAPGKPARALANTNAPDFNTSYVLMEPSSWFEDTAGRTLIIYTQEQRVVTSSDTLPTTVVGEPTGDPLDPSSYIMLMGPVQYIQVPASGGGTGRVPVWTAVPTNVINTAVNTRTIGSKTAFLTNPVGWYEISAGLFTPYW